MRNEHRRWLVGLAGLLVGGFSFVLAADFDPVEIDEKIAGSKTVKKTLETALADVLQGTKQPADVKADCDKYIQKYLIPTVVNVEKTRETTEPPRNALLKLFGPTRAPNAQGRQYLLDASLAELTRYARGNYSPQVKAQAFLILGDLNSREAIREKSVPPTPSAPAFKLLLEEIQKPEHSEGIRLAILVGLVRHAHLNANDTTRGADEKISAGDLDKLETVALDLLGSKTPAGVSPEGHDWLRRRAAELAGFIAAVRPSQKIIDKVVAVVGDRKDSAEVRLAASAAMANVARRSAAGPKLPLKPLADGLAFALIDTLSQRLDKFDADREKVMKRRKIEQALQGGKTSGGGGVPKLDESDPFADHTDVFQRWAVTKLMAAQTGLIGSADFGRTQVESPTMGLYTGTVAPADKKVLDMVKNQVTGGLFKVLKEVRTDDPFETVAESVRTALKEAETAVDPDGATAPKAKKAEAPADGDAPPEEAPAEEPPADAS